MKNNGIATVCPYCGSNNISQTDKIKNFVISRLISKGINTLAGGLRISTGGSVENGMLNRNYVCHNCGKTWVGDGHNPENLPDDEFICNKIVQDICNNKYDFSDHSAVMMLQKKLDQTLLGIRNYHGGYFSVSPKQQMKILFLKGFAALQYAINVISCKEYDSEDAFFADILQSCHSAGTFFSLAVDEESDENSKESQIGYELTGYIFQTIQNVYAEGNNVCQMPDIPDSTSFVFTSDYWRFLRDTIISLLETKRDFPKQSEMSAQQIVYSFLTHGFMTSMWQLHADYVSSIGHINNYTGRNHGDWNTEVTIFKKEFNVPNNEHIIFVRDNTFLSHDHDQGVVITDCNIYYKEKSSSPTIVKIPWNSIAEVYPGEDSLSLRFVLKKGSVITIPYKYFAKKSETYPEYAMYFICSSLSDVFTDIISSFGNKEQKEASFLERKWKVVAAVVAIVIAFVCIYSITNSESGSESGSSFFADKSSPMGKFSGKWYSDSDILIELIPDPKATDKGTWKQYDLCCTNMLPYLEGRFIIEGEIIKLDYSNDPDYPDYFDHYIRGDKLVYVDDPNIVLYRTRSQSNKQVSPNDPTTLSDYTYTITGKINKYSAETALKFIMFLKQWNNGISYQKGEELRYMYSDIAIYYHMKLTPDQIAEKQASYFSKNPTRRQYVKNIEVNFTGDFEATVFFDKYSVRSVGEEPSKYRAYLKMIVNEGEYDLEITTEGDTTTDANLERRRQQKQKSN